jgi:hypothetical protein
MNETTHLLVPTGSESTSDVTVDSSTTMPSIVDSWVPSPAEVNGNDWILKDAIHVLNLIITLTVFIMALIKELNVSECLIYKPSQ